jgi:AcrR family transcriptional regulator
MTEQSSGFIKSWDGHIKELIKISAKKADRVEKKHEQIVKGASKVFLEKGFHPTTIREISEAAGMSMGQLYHYVSSKDDILFLIHRSLQIGFFKHMEKHPPLEEDAVAALTGALRRSQTFMVENNKLFQFIYRESKYLSKKHLQVVLQMDDKNIVEYWRRLIDAINKQKNLQIDTNFSANLITYLTVFIPMRGWNLKDRPISEQQELLIEHILRAIGVN